MNKIHRAVVLAAIVIFPGMAAAVIKVDNPVSSVYERSETVLVGTVDSLSSENRVVTLKVDNTLKGASVGEQVRILIARREELFKSVAANQRAVVMVSKGGKIALVHLADLWMLAEPVGESKSAWRVIQRDDEARKKFPGRTAALVRLLAELKAGRSTILNRIDNRFLSGGVRKLAQLNVTQPRWLMAVDVNGDKKPDVVLGTEKGVRLFVAAGDAYEDATAKWGLQGADGACHASGDVNGDGKIDLLIGKTLWANDGATFSAKARFDTGDKPPFAAALVDVEGRGKLNAVYLSDDGTLRVFGNPGAADQPWIAEAAKPLWSEDGSPVAAAFFGAFGDNGKPHAMVVRESGITRYALDDTGGPPADFERLTGVNLQRYYERYSKGLKNALAVTMDINGDGRPDLFVCCDTGGLLLVNRGFGGFLADYDAGRRVIADKDNRVPFKLTPGTPWAAASLRGDGFDDFLVLTSDGTLYAVANPPPK